MIMKMELNPSKSDKDIETCRWSTGSIFTIQGGEENSASKLESAKLFARRKEDSPASFTTQLMLDSLTARKISRTSLLSHVEYDSTNNELSLVEDRSNIRSRFGFDVGRQPYVYPEEALYLLECGKAEIFCNHISLSVQRARSLLLFPHGNVKENERVGKIKYCTDEEYLVYKCLTKMGYCLYRFKPSTDNCDTSQMEEPGKMEMDDEVVIEENHGIIEKIDEDIIEIDRSASESPDLNRNALKRKYPDNFNQDAIFNEEMENYADLQSMSSYFDNLNSILSEPSGYTVDEADSDVEIVDEVIFSHGGVEIQEIAHSVGCGEEHMKISDEPVPSTSKGPQMSEVLVDLVSSDDEEEDMKDFSKKVWAKFVPNAKVFFKMPPSRLIPHTIPSDDNIYEFDLKDKSDISDLELEFLVDEVSLNDDKYGMCSSDSSHSFSHSGIKSWKDWRQNIFQEARNVMNNSLLASSDYINGETATDKLFLWDSTQKDMKLSTSLLNRVVYEMYGPALHGYSRQKAVEGNPLYYVLISRQDEPVPDFELFGSSIDGVPILIAVVCDSGENDVLFMTSDRSPLNSLF